jgi:CelD/BcsL family acetyltransferase involved in cellulose biosynthesis
MREARSACGAVVDGAGVIAFLDERWDVMSRANPHSTVFQTREWYTAWIRAVSAEEFAEPVILCTPDARSPRAALALEISREPSSAPVLRPLSAPWADYHEAVGNPEDREGVATLGAALLQLVEGYRTRLRFDDVKPGGMLAAIMEEVPCSKGSSSVTESIGLNDDGNWRRIQQHHEYSLKWRRLSRLGDVHCVHHTQPAVVLAKLPEFIAMHRRQWSDRPDAVATFDGGLVDRGFRAIAEHLAPRRMAMLTELTLDATPLAMYFGFIWQRTYFAYRTTYERQFARFSPGHLMLRRMMSDFRDAGLAELDLMRGGYGYKREYSNRASHNLCFEMRGVAD